MAVVEDIELRVTVDATAAQKGLDETRKAAESMGGRIGTLREAMKGFQQKLGPAAAAISGVSTALGQTNGEAGKALAAIGQVAAAFAAGGPLGAGLAAGTYAVDALSQSWERQIKAQDDALSGIYRATEGYVKNLQTARGELEKARGEFVAAARGGRELTPEERKQQLRDEAAGRIAAAEAAAQQARAQVDLAKATELAATFDMTFGQARLLLEKTRASNIRIADRALEQEKEALQTRINAITVAETMRKKAEEEKGQNEFLADSIADIAAQQRAAAAAARERNRVEAEMRTAQRSDPTLSFRAYKFKGLATKDDDIEADIDRWATAATELRAFEKLKTDIIKEATDERLRLGLEAAQRHQEIVQQEYAVIADTVVGAVGVMTSATQDYLDARIKGEEDAEAAFAAAIMRQAGQALISFGTQAIGRGILELSSPVTAPLAAGSFAAGGALIAGGIALGGAATAVMHTAAGGTVGQPVPTSTSGGGGDMAARARPARPGTAGAGGTNLTIIYGGLSGPSADDGARALGKGLERARRRGIV